jgi:hypothetical protein
MKPNSPLKMSSALVREFVVSKASASDRLLVDRERFLTECLVEPEAGLVKIDEFHARNLGFPPGDHRVWFITRGDPQSVFFDEIANLFGCCWGPDKDTGDYVDLGYRSQDPVEMYLV